jgi:hypothetical protein
MCTAPRATCQSSKADLSGAKVNGRMTGEAMTEYFMNHEALL